LTYQENDGDVQSECDHGVGEEWEVANVLDVCHGQLWNLKEESSDTVHNSASWSEVVKGDKRVHLELGRRQKALNHSETNSLEDNTGDLEEETSEDKLDLAKGGNDNTNNDQRDVSKSLEVWWGDAHSPGSEKDSDWSGGLVVVSGLNRAYVGSHLTLSI